MLGVKYQIRSDLIKNTTLKNRLLRHTSNLRLNSKLAYPFMDSNFLLRVSLSFLVN